MATPVFLPGESYGQSSLEGYRPWGHTESDMTERAAHTQDIYNVCVCVCVYTNTLICMYMHIFMNTHTHTHCRRKRQPTPVFLPGKSHGHWSLVGYSPWGPKELNMTEQLTHT